MANYHSIIHNYGRPQSNFNTELAVNALGYKQGKYDANAAKIDELLSSYGDIELSRPEAKEYLYDRISGLVENINGLQGADLSSRNVTSGIMGHISKALDQTVINEYQSTQYEKDYFKQAEEAKKKGTYNDANFYQGYKNIKQWQESELGTPLGKVNYTPYKDVKTEKMDQFEKLLKLKGIERVWDQESPNGMTYKMKGNVIEAGEIRSMYDGLLSTEDKNQLRIESEYLTSQYTEPEKNAVVQQYQQQVDSNISRLKKEEDALRSKATTLSGNEKEQAMQAAEILKIKQQNLSLTKDSGFDSIAFQMYDNKMEQDFVDLYEVSTITDYELNTDMLDYQSKVLAIQKTGLEMQKIQKELTALEATEAGQDYNMVATAGEQGVPMAYVDTTIKGLETASNNLVAAVASDAQQMDDSTFQTTYGVDKGTFASKSPEEKKRFLSTKVESFIKDGVDITSTGYSQQMIDAANEYRAADQAFRAVAEEVDKGSQSVAEGLYEGMRRGATQGSFNPDNFQNKNITSILKRNMNKPFNELDAQSKKVFEISAIDETLRNDYVDDSATQLILVKRREKLISEIQDPKIRKAFKSVSTLQDTVMENTISGLWKASPMDLLFPNRSKDPEKIRQAREEFNQAATDMETSWFFGGGRPDQTLSDLGSSSIGTAPDFYVKENDGRYAPANAGQFVQNAYKNVVKTVGDKAAQTAPLLPSTRTIVLNPAIKSEQDDANSLKSILASAKGVNVMDMDKEIVNVTYDKNSGSYTISSNLKRSLAGAPDGVVGSTPISTTVPYSMFPLQAIKTRTKTDEDSWALNAQNPRSSNLKFTSGGFSSQKERTDFATTMLEQGKISQDVYLNVMKEPQVIGLTTKEKQTYLDVSRTEEGKTVKLSQEYPNAYRALVDPSTKLKKEINNRKGVYVAQYSIRTPQGEITLPVAQNVGTQLNFNDQYLESFNGLNNIYNMITKGYVANSEEVMSILRELNGN